VTVITVCRISQFSQFPSFIVQYTQRSVILEFRRQNILKFIFLNNIVIGAGLAHSVNVWTTGFQAFWHAGHTHWNIITSKAFHKQIQRTNERSPFASELLPACIDVTTHAAISPVHRITQVNLCPKKSFNTLHWLILQLKDKFWYESECSAVVFIAVWTNSYCYHIFWSVFKHLLITFAVRAKGYGGPDLASGP
jgi:hypothetical protein